MHGILKPSRNSGTYSPPNALANAPYERRVSFGTAQSQQMQQHNQQAAPHQWGNFHANTNTYLPPATPSTMYPAPQAPQYTVPNYASSATHSTPSRGDYSSPSNLYTYPSLTPTAPSPVQHQHVQPVSTDTASPTESPRHERVPATVYGIKYSTTYSSLDDMIAALKVEMDHNSSQMPPFTTTTELCLSAGAMLPLLRPTIGPYAEGGDSDLPPEFKTNYLDSSPTNTEDATQAQLQSQLQQSAGPSKSTQNSQSSDDVVRACPRADISAILSMTDPRMRNIVQRASSRGLVQHVENLDGFKYTFNNAWSAKDEDGLRFSYICQDSMQNKDRHANGYNRTQKRVENTGTRGPRKPTFDCKGSISVKFSAKLQACVLHYRHCAIHSTVADRKPLTRPSTLRNTVVDAQGRKRKRSTDDDLGSTVGHAPLAPMGPPPVPQQLDRQPSLFELLQQSAAESAQRGGQIGDAQTPWWSNS